MNLIESPYFEVFLIKRKIARVVSASKRVVVKFSRILGCFNCGHLGADYVEEFIVCLAADYQTASCLFD